METISLKVLATYSDQFCLITFRFIVGKGEITKFHDLWIVDPLGTHYLLI